jgi:hypothetical protein
VITKSKWKLRQQQWSEYHRWASAESLEHPSEQAIADLGAILEWLPDSKRYQERDPERRGVRRMHFLLGSLKGA